MKKRVCGNCRFWVMSPITNDGECHKNPPTATIKYHPPEQPYPVSHTIYPKTKRDDWCGGYEDGSDGYGL